MQSHPPPCGRTGRQIGRTPAPGHLFQNAAPCVRPSMVRFRGEAGAHLLQRGGALIIRRMCGHMGPQRVFCELAGVLADEEDLPFASTLVQVRQSAAGYDKGVLTVAFAPMLS